ncbi:MAG: phosphotransferase, partial [Saprospiraceae bacterium]|nr:phosphotransferase [Saprospiraceae bacterium]
TDPDSFLLALEDLGDASDYTSIYQEDVFLDSADLYRAIYYLHKLHLLPLSAFPLNEEMRKLNHEHIFHFPFNSENGLDLEGIQKGLGQVALPFQKDTILKGKIQRLGEVYLSQGRCLIHGDYYPGSWLKTDRGLMVIDPEFAFHGPPEFDLAVMFAHLIMAKHNPAVLKKAWQNYHAPANFDHRLLSSFTGVEIMRRIIGIAQLPLSLTIADKINLMSKASEWIREENLLDKINI